MHFKAVLIDISGTIHIGDHVIPGAIEACRKLFSRSNSIKVLFLTNTSKISSVALLHQLRTIGFDESSMPLMVNGTNTIMTSVGATRQYLIENNLRPYCLIEDELMEQDFKGVSKYDPNCVLVGLAPSKFHYERLNEAYRLLLKLKNNRGHDSEVTSSTEQNHVNSPVGESQHRENFNTSRVRNNTVPFLIAIHRATHYRDSDHQLSLGPGGFLSLLEQTTGIMAHTIGKPSSDFYLAALSVLGVDDPSDAVMVGDDVVGDIKGALESGLGASILVKTGKYVDGDELGLKTNGVVPTLTVDSIVEAVDYICANIHN